MENESNKSTALSRVVEAITWRGIGLNIIHTINYFAGIDHIEIHSEKPTYFQHCDMIIIPIIHQMRSQRPSTSPLRTLEDHGVNLFGWDLFSGACLPSPAI